MSRIDLVKNKANIIPTQDISTAQIRKYQKFITSKISMGYIEFPVSKSALMVIAGWFSSKCLSLL